MNRTLLLFVLFVLLSACAGPKVPPVKTASQYFAEGEEFFADEEYEDAIASYEKVSESYQSADLATKAELRIAESRYRHEDYVEAATAFDAFLKRHPGHPETEDILVKTGDSYYQEVLAIDRDQTYTQNALSTYRQLLREYPDTIHRQEAEERIESSLKRLAEREFYIARFYFKTGEYPSAIQRLLDLLSDYPSFGENPETYYILGLAHLRNGDREAGAAALNLLQEKFPKSKFTKKARKALNREF